MTTLTVSTRGMDNISFNPPLPVSSDAAYQEWQQLAADFLHYAFNDRPVCLITDDGRASSLLYTDNLPNTSEITVDEHKYLLAFVGEPSRELFARVVGSSEFHWDAIWLAPLNEEDNAGVSQLMSSYDLEAPERVSGEVLTSHTDGSGLTWLKPARPRDEIIGKLRELTEAAGWTLDVQAT